MDVYRHGDVLISPIEEIPEHAVKQPDLILARGELTGHAHRAEPAGAAEMYEHEGNLFLRVLDSPARIVHEEHGPIELLPGVYRVWRQREYNPQVNEQIIED